MVSLQNVNIHFQLKLIKKRLLYLFFILILLPVSIQDINYNTQWNQGTGKIGSLLISGVRYIEVLFHT